MSIVAVLDFLNYVPKYAEIDPKFLSCHMLIKKEALIKDFRNIKFNERKNLSILQVP